MTLVPHVPDFAEEFKCHMRYLPPRFLYLMTHFMKLDDTFYGEETLTKYTAGVSRSEVAMGTTYFHHMILNHSTTLDLNSADVILRAQRGNDANFRYKVFNLKSSDDFKKCDFKPTQISDDEWSLTVQGKTPFNITTQTWGPDYGCEVCQPFHC